MILYLAKLAGDVNEAVVDGIISSDRPTHSRQRRLMAHAFSEKALREQEGFIQEYVNKLIDLLSAKAKEGGVDMVRAYNFTSKLMFPVPSNLFRPSVSDKTPFSIRSHRRSFFWPEFWLLG